MSHNLECLCYEGTDSKGRLQTVYYSNIKGMSVEEIEKRANALRLEGKTNVRALSWADYEAIEIEESKITCDLNKPIAIDATEFKEKLNLLPPCRWSSSQGTEVFYLSGAITGNIHKFYVRLGQNDSAKYFCVNAQITSSNDEILNLCASA